MWAILYDDGKWFTNEDGAPWEAPICGVLVIEQDGGHDSPLQNVDHYLWREDEGCWLPVMHDGVIMQFSRFARRITACVNGATVSYPTWNRLAKQRVPRVSNRRYEVG